MTNTEVGYILVNVSTARGALPIEDALVTISSVDKDMSDIYAVVKTNSSGNTEKISVPAPPKKLSEQPGNLTPYALYNIEIDKEGYYSVTNLNVPVFSGVTAIQPVEMIPIADDLSMKDFPESNVRFNENIPPDL